MQRLRDFAIGQIVQLKGAASDKLPALFIGKVIDGYFYLYRNLADIETGRFPDCVATASHYAIEVK